ncbi:MAG: EAL domain-containing protein [Campylobacteraceae bacterium]|nr:EAL domain-containing protein [Campylobacteraceae bacterium]
MNKFEFKKLILNAKYYTKYEPIFHTKTLDIFGYEALSKFDINENLISTEEIFRELHSSNELFFNLEKINKKRQIDSFILKGKLFLNFDADIVYTPEQEKYWAEFLLKYRSQIVIEITENGSDDEKSAVVMRNFASWLQKLNIDFALDDFAQEGSMFSFYIMSQSKYIKIDKSFLRMIDDNKNYIPYFEGLLKTINLNGQFSIIEGVETKEDYDLCKKMNADFIQGYYFKNQAVII